MSSLTDRIRQDIKAAMRQKDKATLSTLRLALSAVQSKEMDTGSSLDDDGVIQVIASLLKQRRDSAQQYRAGQRDDLAAKEEQEIAILSSYLPKQLSEHEINEHIIAVIAQHEASSMADMGKVMASLKPKLQGVADMQQVSKLVRQKLGGAS